LTNIRFTNQASKLLKEKGVFVEFENAIVRLADMLGIEAILVCKEGYNLRIIVWL